MSLLYQSPMSKKIQAFFLIWTFGVMGLFALVGINISEIRYGRAALFAAISLLMAGCGFMIRKRILRQMGLVPSKE